MKYYKEVTIILPLPPSVNGLYAGMARRFKSKKYKEWLEQAVDSCGTTLSKYEVNPDVWFKTEYTYYMPLWYKNGNVKKRDVGNYEKAVSDFLGDNIEGFDDMMIADMRLKKLDSERNEVVCVIQEIDAS